MNRFLSASPSAETNPLHLQGDRATHRHTTDPRAAELHAADPRAAELHAADPRAAELHAADPRAAQHRKADPPTSLTVGRVVALWRYPVKSMGAEALEQIEVSWHGLAGDRRWAFVREGMERRGFPWLTIRERPTMGHYRPSFAEPTKPDASPTLVHTPSGGVFDVVDPALAAELGDGVRVIKQDRGVFDTMPLSLLTTQTVAGLGALVGAELAALRFRPNMLIEAVGDGAFPEDGWVGSVVRIGGLVLRVDQRDRRCMVVNVDPATAERDPAVLRAIARERQAGLGVYGSTVRPGRVAVGDAVVLEGWRLDAGDAGDAG
jgi:uncharacterized protein